MLMLSGMGFPISRRSCKSDEDRYLTAIDTKYHDGLSEASKQSLKFQGGPFVGDELEKFRSDPLSEDMVRLRRWDDGAKIVGIEKSTPRVEVYREMMINHLEKEALQAREARC